jgi:hypothetical protein
MSGNRIGDLRAGDRVPDLDVAGGRLYDLVDTSTLTLFVSDGATPIVDACLPWADVVTVRKTSLPDELVTGSGWLLVRPDGYLAAAGRADDAPRLRDWLDRWLTPTPS